MHKLIIGLTGGIGSGKSTVANLFAELGAGVIDADKIAHEITAPNSNAYHTIIKHFGHNILNADNTLNRKKLRELIFTNAEERKWLEEQLHPIILEKMHQQAQLGSAPYCLFVIPLLFETHYDFKVDRVLVVDCDVATQIKRAMSRDNSQFEQIQRILKTQVSRDYRLCHADDVIANMGDLNSLKIQVKRLHEQYLRNNSH